MSTWFCFGCQKNIGDNQYCPYCGMHRLGDFGYDTVVKNKGDFKRFFGEFIESEY